MIDAVGNESLHPLVLVRELCDDLGSSGNYGMILALLLESSLCFFFVVFFVAACVLSLLVAKEVNVRFLLGFKRDTEEADLTSFRSIGSSD